MRRLLLLLPVALIAAASWTGASAPAGPGYTKADGTQTMDDGVVLATTLYLPDGQPPAQGWPGIVMLHGLGASRQDTNTWAEQYFAGHGYAILTYDARGHGQSGGLVGIAGPREIADLRAVFQAFAARPDVDDAHIGAWGISYGGGQIWDAAVDGVPFAAIETVETWTDLYSALFPQNLAKSGVVGGFLNEIAPGKLDPAYAFVGPDVFAGTGLPQLRALAAQRSSLAKLGQLKIPVLMLQGRRDFAFGLEQAEQAFAKLPGPKRLYIGDHGHPPSTFPAADTPYAMTEARLWFDRFLRGEQNGIDERPPVEVAPDPWRGKAVSYAGLPPTRNDEYAAPGRKTIGKEGVVVRALGTAKTALEEFGAPLATVRVTVTGPFPRIVAVLTAVEPGGKQVVVSSGGVPAAPGTRTVRIRMIDDATFVPARSKLTLTIASNTQKTAAGLLYLDLPKGGGKLTVRDATVTMPILLKPISR